MYLVTTRFEQVSTPSRSKHAFRWYGSLHAPVLLTIPTFFSSGFPTDYREHTFKYATAIYFQFPTETQKA